MMKARSGSSLRLGGEKNMTANVMISAIGRRVHKDEAEYIDEAFANMPNEEREFIKRYIAEA
jgi:hypothetical protein